MIKFTKQYVGGLIAGFGLATFISKSCIKSLGIEFFDKPFIMIGGMGLIVIGGMIVRSDQNKNER